MGEETKIFVRKGDLPKIIDSFNSDFLFIEGHAGRWYRFKNKFHLDEGIGTKKQFTSKELLGEIAKSDEKIKDREKWVDLLNKYPMIFQGDYSEEEVPDEFIDIGNYYYRMLDFLKKESSIEQVMEMMKSE